MNQPWLSVPPVNSLPPRSPLNVSSSGKPSLTTQVVRHPSLGSCGSLDFPIPDWPLWTVSPVRTELGLSEPSCVPSREQAALRAAPGWLHRSVSQVL